MDDTSTPDLLASPKSTPPHRFWDSMSPDRNPTVAVDMDHPLEIAIRDAELLIAFAVQSNRLIGKERIEQINQAVYALRDAGSNHTPEQVTAFWVAYDALAVMLAPQSGFSIRATLHETTKPFHKNMTFWIALTALALFLFALIMQWNWLAGKSVVERGEQLGQQRAELLKKFDDSAARWESEHQRMAALCARVQFSLLRCRWYGEPGTVSINEKDKIGAESEAQLIAHEITARKTELDRLSAESQRIFDHSNPIEAMLDNWHDRIGAVCRNGWLARICPFDYRKQTDEENLAKLTVSAMVKQINESEAQKAVIHSYHETLTLEAIKRKLAWSHFDRFSKLTLETRLVLDNIGTYLIPLLMGMLGALTYILRGISMQLKDHSFTPKLIAMQFNRVCLGAIAGVFGSLVTPLGDVKFGGVPPLFIPFFFGYAIEVMFALIDRVVKNITMPQGSPPKG